MGTLTEIIKKRIASEGPISFRDYMEMALYYPELGYYRSAKEKIGPDGDYYTSPTVTGLFGEMIATQIEEMWLLTGGGAFTIVEYGAGTGKLCRDVLRQLKENTTLYEKLHYCIIEKSPALRENEQGTEDGKVMRHESIHAIKGFTGCVISNELVDNFAVHQVVMQDELMEIFVDDNSGFCEVLRPASDVLKHYLTQLGVVLPKGYRAEINLDALEWISDVASSIAKGFVVTVDYGYASEELYSMRRRNGTLACYAGHKVNYDPYRNTGEQDITAHVNFSALHHHGNEKGLHHCGFTDQGHFLHSLGIAAHLRKKEEQGHHTGGNVNIAALAHMLMTDMGSKFKVLIQQKGIKNPELSGLRFSHRLT